MAPKNFETTKDNLPKNEIAWVKEQVRSELTDLKKEAFYKIDGDVVHYDMEAVAKYLDTLKTKNRNDLISKNTSAWMMAVQIALESEGYDVGTIDGIYGNRTHDAVVRFQKEVEIEPDGQPGSETITKLLEKLTETPKTPTAKDGVQVEIGEEVKAEDLVNNLPDGAAVSFEDPIDTSKEGKQDVVVIVKVGDKETKVTVTIEIVKEKIPTAKADVKVEVGKEVKAEDLVDNLPKEATVEFKEGNSVDTSKEGKQDVTIIIKQEGKDDKELSVTVEVVNEKEVSPKSDVKIEVGKEVKAEDLVDNLPKEATVEFKEGNSVDTSEEGKQDVTIIVKQEGKDDKELSVTVEIFVKHIFTLEQLYNSELSKFGGFDVNGKWIWKNDIDENDEGLWKGTKRGFYEGNNPSMWLGENDKLDSGYGIRAWSNGDEIRGSWKNGEPYGVGKLKHNGKTYDVDWSVGICSIDGYVVEFNGVVGDTGPSLTYNVDNGERITAEQAAESIRKLEEGKVKLQNSINDFNKKLEEIKNHPFGK